MRTKINLILTALIALLTGCKAPTKAVQQNNNIRVMYGPPSYFQQQQQENTTLPKDTTEKEATDTIIPLT